jgi:hypothetical protein
MSGVKEQTLKRALAMLNAIGATYAVIEEGGKKHGTLEVIEPKKRGNKYPHGELSSYASKHIANMNVGDIQEIPFGKYEGEEVRAAAVSWACYHWGNGTATTATIKDKQLVEFLRIA